MLSLLLMHVIVMLMISAPVVIESTMGVSYNMIRSTPMSSSSTWGLLIIPKELPMAITVLVSIVPICTSLKSLIVNGC